MTVSATKREKGQIIVISIIAHELAKGRKLAQIFEEILHEGIFSDDNRKIKISKATLYRWWKEYLKAGNRFEPKKPPLKEKGDGSSLPQPFVDFLVEKKREDPEASIPEIIKQAEQKGIVAKDSISRCTAYRCAKQRALPLMRQQGKRYHHMLRFSYPHRMMMVLCDGKHFRVGTENRKRVALVFMDDATRYVLHAVVGTSESADLFARGLFELVSRFGNQFTLFLDNGPGFIAQDNRLLCESLSVHLIHGTARYPEGRGKIERWNRSFQSSLLRVFRSNPKISSEIPELEDRINHYIHEIYNKTVHSSLNGMTPYECWSQDTKPLNLVCNIGELRTKFYLTYDRKVSRDNIISIDGLSLEVPGGYAGRHVTIRKNVLCKEYSLLDKELEILLTPVDPTANSYIRRKMNRERTPISPTRETAATMLYDQQSPPSLIDDVGNCFE